MNRQRIRVIALAALLVAGGAYVWAQRTASTVKPAQTSNAAVNKPGNLAPGAKPLAPAATKPSPAGAATNAANATTPANAGGPVAAAGGAAKPAAPPQAVAAGTAPARAKTNPANNAGAKPAAVPPAAAAVAAAAVPAAPVEAAAWRDHLQKGAYLAEQLRTRLPAGADLVAASAGFRDLQQFVSAVAAAHNLKLDFEELKRRVVTDGKGLAPAIDAMKKVASATIEEQRAEYEARGLIQEAKRHPLPASKTEQPKKPFRSQSGV